jgi:small nuclear ribonucleoprotein B and B'
MLVGTFLAFDKHMNLVLADTEEYRRIKSKKAGEPEREHRRPLGLVLLRGDSIIHMSAEAQPSQPTRRIGETEGKGKAQAASRGVAVAPVGQAPAGLAGPGRGVGAPGMSNMLPTGKAVTSAPTRPPPPAMGMGGPGAPMPPPPGMGGGMGMPPGIRPPMPPMPPQQPPPPGMGMGGPPPPGGMPPQSRPPPPTGLPPGIRPPNSK